MSQKLAAIGAAQIVFRELKDDLASSLGDPERNLQGFRTRNRERNLGVLRLTSILETYTFSPTVRNFVVRRRRARAGLNALPFQELLTPCAPCCWPRELGHLFTVRRITAFPEGR